MAQSLGGSAGDFDGLGRSIGSVLNGFGQTIETVQARAVQALPSDPRGRNIGTGGIDISGQDTLRRTTQTLTTNTIASQARFEDRRVRLRPMTPLANKIIFGDVNGSTFDEFGAQGFTDGENILAPLHPATGKTNGLIFPYTPSITYTYQAEWNPQPLVHTNYQVESYSRSYPSEINISGMFTSQTEEEARYSLAVIHFFRTITKMYFGKTGSSGTTPGTPPPVLLFSGHGELFNDIPVVVKMFQHELLNDSDYVPVTFQKGNVMWVPIAFNILVTLGIQLNLRKTREEFDLDKFRTGKLITEGGWL